MRVRIEEMKKTEMRECDGANAIAGEASGGDYGGEWV